LETYRIENLIFAYKEHEPSALNNISLTIERGDFVVLCGPSGCGKTTLLRQLKPGLIPHGLKSGSVYFEDILLGELSPKDAATKIGFVLQSPENQIVTDKVWHELAFGLENIGLKTPEIRLRVAEMASFFGIAAWFHKPVAELSGGQKQLLALASVMAMQPSVLILDEPTSQLDPIAAGEFLAIVAKINRELGVTVILTEHRLEEAFPLATRALVMDKGQIIADGTPKEAALKLKEYENGMFLAMPTPMRVWMSVADGVHSICDVPITPRDGAKWLLEKSKEITNYDEWKIEKTPVTTDLEPALNLDEVWFKYEKHLPDVLKSLSFKAYYGEITAVLGGNGTGKTTMLSLIAGLYKPYRGSIYTNDTAYALPQDPQSLFVAKTLREDLLEILSEKKLSKEETARKLTYIEKLCRLEGLLERHPYDLSGGEQQRAALAKVLLLQPEILLLDEPTKGLDAEYKQIFAQVLNGLKSAGAAIIIVSHDIEFCAEYADRCALFFNGNIVTENTPREFFRGNSFYTTAANRMARHAFPGAVTAKDLILALGGKMLPVPEDIELDIKYDAAEKEVITKPQNPLKRARIQKKSPLPKRTITAAILIMLCIPLTIYLGMHLLDDRRFYFISMLIMLQTIIPFALIFEGRKPQAREIIIIAVLCAIAVAGRSAFFMLPQFKPVIAVVIIAGVAFGGESGFLVGAMTAFVSNMFFGQGPWTPWQMFAFGIIGFLAGVLFHTGFLRRSPVPLAIFGGLATFIIFGGIMNPASVIIWQPNPTIEMFLLAYFHGLPFDIIHAVSTVFFLLIISRPMLEKLDRIKTKYGLVE